MKAVVCTSFGPPESLKIVDADTPIYGADEVLIKVMACGLNFPDTLIIAGKYQFKPPFPITIGAEAAGIILAVGSNVKDFEIGDAVVTWCATGGCAEELCVSAFRVFKMSAGLSFAHVAAVFYNFHTAYHALHNRGKLLPGQKILVLGAGGGLGLAAVKIAKAMGAVVIACASSESKRNLAMASGAHAVVDYMKEGFKDYLKEAYPEGFELVFDPVGDPYASVAMRSLAWGGTYLVLGFAGGQIPEIKANIPLLKGAAVTGVFFSKFAMEFPHDWHQNHQDLLRLLPLEDWRHLELQVDVLENTPIHLRAMIDRKLTGKVVIAPHGVAKAEEVAIVKQSEGKIIEFKDVESLKKEIGNVLGQSQWHYISQERINAFGLNTNDLQWIHTMPAKAERTDFGGTIAHGFLTLSLIPGFLTEIYRTTFNTAGINYGVDKVRFTHPVKVGSYLKAEAEVLEVIEIKKTVKVLLKVTVWIKGEPKPACVAEMWSVLIS